MGRVVDKFVARARRAARGAQGRRSSSRPRRAPGWPRRATTRTSARARSPACIQTELKDRISDELLFGELARGGRVSADLGDGALVFRSARRALRCRPDGIGSAGERRGVLHPALPQRGGHRGALHSRGAALHRTSRARRRDHRRGQWGATTAPRRSPPRPAPWWCRCGERGYGNALIGGFEAARGSG